MRLHGNSTENCFALFVFYLVFNKLRAAEAPVNGLSPKENYNTFKLNIIFRLLSF